MLASRRHIVALVLGIVALLAFTLTAIGSGGQLTLLSTSGDGVKGNGLSYGGRLTPDGTRLVFTSRATNLHPADTDSLDDVFLKDLSTGEITLVSTNAAGEKGEGDSGAPSISADGRYVAFISLARNLHPDVTGGHWAIFVKDLQTGAVVAASTSAAGVAGDNGSYEPTITADGSKVGFLSYAYNLVPNGPTSGGYYVKDLQTGAIELVSKNEDGEPADVGIGNPVLSADGSTVAFWTGSINLHPLDTDRMADVYVIDLATGGVTLASVSEAGEKGNSDSYSPSLSADGSVVAFESEATNLHPSDTDATRDVYVRDLRTGSLSFVSQTASGVKGNRESAEASVTPDGSMVAFRTVATNLDPRDTDFFGHDLYLKNLSTGELTLLTVTADGLKGNGHSYGPVQFDAAGETAVFVSEATNLSALDTDPGFDIYMKDIAAAPVPSPTPAASETPPLPSAGPTEGASATPQPSPTPPPPSEMPSEEPSEQPSEEPSEEPSQEPPTPAGPPDGPLVQASGTELRLSGEPYDFIGMNVYNANTRVHSCWYPFTQAELEASFTEMGDDVDVIRAWFFQDFATTSGARNWTAFDQTLAAAEATGKKVIVTLGNHWGDCDVEGTKTAAWYGGGYTQRNPALPASYRDFVAEVVSRYGHRSTILMWQLLNEAEVPLFTPDGLCDEAIAHPLLKNWAADVSGLIKSIDPNHLVSIGTIGSGQCGAQFTDYKSLHDIPTVDLCEFHDYGTAVMPGDQWNGLAFRIQQCNELGKPIFVGETGITPDWLDGTLQARADLFRDKLTTQMDAGVVGEVMWAWNAFESLTNTYDIGPGDPVFAMLAGLDDPDLDDDGVDDRIDTGTGSFTYGATSGSVTDAAGYAVLVAPDGTDEVRITVTGSGTAKASFTVCGFTLRLAPGSDVVVGCGSITTSVLVGSAELVLGGGLTVVTVAEGVTATVDEHADGSFAVSGVSGGSVTVVVDGLTNTVGPGETLTLEAWDFIGFEAPVDNGGVLNVVKAGSVVPLRWRLLDASGAPVTDLAHVRVTVTTLACSAGTSADLLEETGSGASGLQHLGNGYYQFNWKTPKAYANSCKTMRLDIGDGVVHIAQFQFKK